MNPTDQADIIDSRSTPADGPVECLGRHFANQRERREWFIERLRKKLRDPEFRARDDFPIGDEETILTLSDPPYYTACPNPFIADFITHHGRDYDPSDGYRREPFAVDVSVGKTDPLYKAHGYHTKVPHQAIVPSILHYTRPGDRVLDGFCGSGMTGVATQWCATAPEDYRLRLEADWARQGREPPVWGARHALLGDLSPAATFIAANYNRPFDAEAFTTAARAILDQVEQELGWMYDTVHIDGAPPGRIDYTVWSEVFSCPECAGEVVFLDEALDAETKRVRDEFPCPHCGATLSKKNLERVMESRTDPVLGTPWKRVSFRPVLIVYKVGGKRFEKQPDARDIGTLQRIEALPFPTEVPTNAFPTTRMYHGSRIAPKGFTHSHHFFLPRAAHALAALWRRAVAHPEPRTRQMLLFFVEQAIWGMSVLARYTPTHYSQVNQYLNGVYYVAAQIVDVSPWYILTGKLSRLGRAFARHDRGADAQNLVTTQSAADWSPGLPTNSIDYIFTDPPFGENIYYADLNSDLAFTAVQKHCNPRI